MLKIEREAAQEKEKPFKYLQPFKEERLCRYFFFWINLTPVIYLFR